MIDKTYTEGLNEGVKLARVYYNAMLKFRFDEVSDKVFKKDMKTLVKMAADNKTIEHIQKYAEDLMSKRKQSGYGIMLEGHNCLV